MSKVVEYKAVLWYNNKNFNVQFAAAALKRRKTRWLIHTTGFGS